LTFSIKVIV